MMEIFLFNYYRSDSKNDELSHFLQNDKKFRDGKMYANCTHNRSSHSTDSWIFTPQKHDVGLLIKQFTDGFCPATILILGDNDVPLVNIPQVKSL